jgi:hypothetical protein
MRSQTTDWQLARNTSTVVLASSPTTSLWVNGSAVVTGSISGASTAVTGSITGASVAVTGALSATSVNGGTLNGSSLSLTGGATVGGSAAVAGTLGVTGAVTGSAAATFASATTTTNGYLAQHGILGTGSAPGLTDTVGAYEIRGRTSFPGFSASMLRVSGGNTDNQQSAIDLRGGGFASEGADRIVFHTANSKRWALSETGGMYIYGATDTTQRPTATTALKPYEIRGIASSAAPYSDGRLRLAAGTGSTVTGTEIVSETVFRSLPAGVFTFVQNTDRLAVTSSGAAVTGDLSATGAISGASVSSSGAVSGTTGTFSGAVSGTTGTFSGAVSGTTGTFSGAVSGTTGTFSGAISGASVSSSGAVSGTTGTFSGAVSGLSASFPSGDVSCNTVSATTSVTTTTVSTVAVSVLSSASSNLVSINTNVDARILIRARNDTPAAMLQFQRSYTDASLPPMGATLGAIHAGPGSTNNSHYSARISFVANENHTAFSRGADAVFEVYPSNGVAPVEKLRLRGTGVGIGHSQPVLGLHVYSHSSVADATLASELISSTAANGPSVALRRGRGTNFTSAQAVQTADLLGEVGVEPYDSTGTCPATPTARLAFWASQGHNSTARGTYLTLSTTADGSTTAVDRVRIDANGRVGINTAAPVTALHVNAGSIVISGDTPLNFAHLNGTNHETSSWGVAKSATQFSGSAAAGDTVLRSTNAKLILQSGTGNAGVVIDQSNNVNIGGTGGTRKLNVFAGDIGLDYGYSIRLIPAVVNNEIVQNAWNIGGDGSDVLRLSPAGNSASTIKFLTAAANGETAAERVRITGGGVVNVFGLSNTASLRLGPAPSISNNDYTSWIQSLSTPLSHCGSDMVFYTHITTCTNGAPAEAMRITASGNVAIGAASASARLHIVTSDALGAIVQTGADRQGNTPSNRRIFFTQDNYRNTIQAQFLSSTWQAADLNLNPDGGFVCVGCTAPAEKFVVHEGNIGLRYSFGINTVNAGYTNTEILKVGWNLGGDGGDVLKLAPAGASGSTIKFFTSASGGAATEAMRITGSGWVGLGGVVNPGGIFHVNRANAWSAITSMTTPALVVSSGAAELRLSAHYTAGVASGSGIQSMDAGSPNNLVLQPAGGAVGIGTTSPGHRLDVIGTGAALRVANAIGSGYAYIQMGQSGTQTNNYHLGTEGDGTFGVWNGIWGNGAVRLRIDLSGDLRTRTVIPLSSGFQLGTSALRWAEIWCTIGVNQVSDRNLKTAVTTTPLGLDFILALEPVSYRMKDEINVPMNSTRRVRENRTHENGTVESVDRDVIVTEYVNRTHSRRHHGLIAQQVKATLDAFNVTANDFAGYLDPAAVGEDGPKGLRYDEFISPVIKAIHELNDKVDRRLATWAADGAPNSSKESCVKGSTRFAVGYLYVCVEANQWNRLAMETEW